MSERTATWNEIPPTLFRDEDRARAIDLYVHVHFQLSKEAEQSLSKTLGARREISVALEADLATVLHIGFHSKGRAHVTVEYRSGQESPFVRFKRQRVRNLIQAIAAGGSGFRVTLWTETVILQNPGDNPFKGPVPIFVSGRPGHFVGFEAETDDGRFGERYRVRKSGIHFRRLVRDLPAASLADVFVVGPKALSASPAAISTKPDGGQLENGR